MPARSGRRDVVLTFPVDLDAFGDRSMFVRFQGRTLGVPDMLEEFADRADLVIRHVAQRPRIHPLILAHPAQAGRLHSRSLREMTYRGQCSTTSANNPSRCSLAESVGSKIHARRSAQRSVRLPTADSQLSVHHSSPADNLQEREPTACMNGSAGGRIRDPVRSRCWSVPSVGRTLHSTERQAEATLRKFRHDEAGEMLVRWLMREGCVEGVDDLAGSHEPVADVRPHGTHVSQVGDVRSAQFHQEHVAQRRRARGAAGSRGGRRTGRHPRSPVRTESRCRSTSRRRAGVVWPRH